MQFNKTLIKKIFNILSFFIDFDLIFVEKYKILLLFNIIFASCQFFEIFSKCFCNINFTLNIQRLSFKGKNGDWHMSCECK